MDRLRRAMEAPWKVRNELLRIALLPRIRLSFLIAGVPWGRGWRIYGCPIIQRFAGSRILAGENLALRSNPRSNPLSPYHPVVLATRSATALIRIGNNVGMTGATIVSSTRIEIDDDVLVGANAVIVDTDFHSLDPSMRDRGEASAASRPVEIGRGAFIGMHALILKGVRIGSGAVIGAGAVVSQDVPPSVVVAGNPAKIVTRLSPRNAGSGVE